MKRRKVDEHFNNLGLLMSIGGKNLSDIKNIAVQKNDEIRESHKTKCRRPDCDNKFKKRGPQLYCSRECRRIYEKQLRDEKYAKELEVREKVKCTYVECGKLFTPKKSRVKFCSETCRLKHIRKVKHDISVSRQISKKCIVCGSVFYTWKKQQKLCSDKKCRTVYQVEYNKRYHKPIVTRNCDVCGKEFTTNKSNQILCGDLECTMQYRRDFQKRRWRKMKNGSC